MPWIMVVKRMPRQAIVANIWGSSSMIGFITADGGVMIPRVMTLFNLNKDQHFANDCEYLLYASL